MSDVEDSLALAQRYPIVWLHLNNPIPYPGTELYEWVRAHSAFVIPPEDYLNSVTEVDDTPVFETPELPWAVRAVVGGARAGSLGSRLFGAADAHAAAPPAHAHPLAAPRGFALLDGRPLLCE